MCEQQDGSPHCDASLLPLCFHQGALAIVERLRACAQALAVVATTLGVVHQAPSLVRLEGTCPALCPLLILHALAWLTLQSVGAAGF